MVCLKVLKYVHGVYLSLFLPLAFFFQCFKKSNCPQINCVAEDDVEIQLSLHPLHKCWNNNVLSSPVYFSTCYTISNKQISQKWEIGLMDTHISKTLIFTTLLGHEIIIFIITIFGYYQFYFQLNMLLSV